MSSTKPMSSISSASSRTTTSSSSSRSAPRFIRSMARPGVATTTSTPSDSAAQLRADGGAAVDGERRGRRRPAAVAGDRPRRPAARARGWGRAPGRTGRCGRVRLGRGSRRGAPASAARTRRSCRCRWRPGRSGHGPRPAARSPRPGSGWGGCSRARRPSAGARGPAGGRRRSGRCVDVPESEVSGGSRAGQGQRQRRSVSRQSLVERNGSTDGAPTGEARGRGGTEPDSGLSRFTTSNRRRNHPMRARTAAEEPRTPEPAHRSAGSTSFS